MHSPTAERQNWQQRKTQPKSDAKARRRKKKFSGKDESGKRKRIKSKKGNNPNRIWKRHGRQRWSSDVMHVQAAVSVRGACSRKRRKKLFLAGFFPVVFRPAHFVVAQGTCFADCTTQELSSVVTRKKWRWIIFLFPEKKKIISLSLLLIATETWIRWTFLKTSQLNENCDSEFFTVNKYYIDETM